ncbi:MAG TPA: hypothetical protein EYP67_02380 [Methanosarcinales archaeon]|nr:hypothetical protein [Methanosarcinales archaeon]
MYLVVARYTDDAERKRIDYAIERWKAVAGVEKPDGVPILFKGEDAKGFVEDLYSRLSRESVSVYSLNDVPFEIEKDEMVIETVLEGDLGTIRKFLGFIMAKQKGVLITETELERTYEVSTRKGKANVAINLTDVGRLRIIISGYGDALRLIHEKIESEIRYFKEV